MSSIKCKGILCRTPPVNAQCRSNTINADQNSVTDLKYLLTFFGWHARNKSLGIDRGSPDFMNAANLLKGCCDGAKFSSCDLSWDDIGIHVQ